MKKTLFILLIISLSILVNAQTYSPVSGNKKYTGLIWFSKPVNIMGATWNNTKVAEHDTLVANDENALDLISISIIPTIYTFAGDTSNMSVPIKIGNIFIDTVNSKVYISKSASANGWLKLN